MRKQWNFEPVDRDELKREMDRKSSERALGDSYVEADKKNINERKNLQDQMDSLVKQQEQQMN